MAVKVVNESCICANLSAPALLLILFVLSLKRRYFNILVHLFRGLVLPKIKISYSTKKLVGSELCYRS